MRLRLTKAEIEFDGEIHDLERVLEISGYARRILGAESQARVSLAKDPTIIEPLETWPDEGDADRGADPRRTP